MFRFPWRTAAVGLGFCLVAAGAALADESLKATSELHNTDGQTVGFVTLRQSPSGIVLLKAEFDGLPPGDHAFHIHTNGTCSPDFKAAGGHYAPREHAHGIDDPKGPHAGDMPNIHVPDSGVLTIEYFLDAVTLEKGKTGSLFKEGGTAFVIHDGVDDYVSQPAGDAGNRIACGVIEAAS